MTATLEGREGGELGAFPTDVDGDGTPDLVLRDDRFLYEFASYAGSRPPPQIFNLVGGRFVDVSTSPRYHAIFRNDFDETRADCLKHDNAACAAMVADAARLGLWAESWQVMLANYDQNSDWTLPGRCAENLVENACPSGKEIVPENYPEALQWFLEDRGYQQE